MTGNFRKAAKIGELPSAEMETVTAAATLMTNAYVGYRAAAALNLALAAAGIENAIGSWMISMTLKTATKSAAPEQIRPAVVAPCQPLPEHVLGRQRQLAWQDHQHGERAS